LKNAIISELIFGYARQSSQFRLAGNSDLDIIKTYSKKERYALSSRYELL
jgi:hypothetical protein